MSNYPLAPCATHHCNHAWWNGSFNPDYCSRIIEIGDALAPAPAVTGDGKVTEIRKSRVAWISLDANTGWLYEQLASVVRLANAQFFGFDLTGFHEDLQYTVYDTEGAKYDWHMDCGTSQYAPPRKLSLSLLLSDPSEYEGGDLEIMGNGEVIRARRERGIVYLFPSYMQHRVTPVLRGVRRSLVAWLIGPQFR